MRLNEQRAVDRTMHLHVQGCTSLSINDSHIVCGCTDGIVRLLDTSTLHILVTLPLPPPLGTPFRNAAFHQTDSVADAPASYSHVLAVGLDMNTEFIACLYADRSIRFWRCTEGSQIAEHLFLPHHAASITAIDSSDAGQPQARTDVHFTTCSADRSVRTWKLSLGIQF